MIKKINNINYIKLMNLFLLFFNLLICSKYELNVILNNILTLYRKILRRIFVIFYEL